MWHSYGWGNVRQTSEKSLFRGSYVCEFINVSMTLCIKGQVRLGKRPAAPLFGGFIKGECTVTF